MKYSSNFAPFRSNMCSGSSTLALRSIADTYTGKRFDDLLAKISRSIDSTSLQKVNWLINYGSSNNLLLELMMLYNYSKGCLKTTQHLILFRRVCVILSNL